MLGFNKKQLINVLIIIATIVGSVYVFSLNSDKEEQIIATLGQNATSTVETIINTENESIVTIESPKLGDTLNGTLQLKGTADKPFTLNLRDSLSNNVLLTLDILEGEFNEEYIYASPSSTSGILEIKEENLIIPINFSTDNNREVRVFFSNINFDPQLKECSKVYPVKRYIANKNPNLGALISLLVGPNKKDKQQGYFTNLPLRVIKINNFEIEDGIASIDFSEALHLGVAGSCRTSAIRAQIEQTLLQFENINKVQVSINSETKGILQP